MAKLGYQDVRLAGRTHWKGRSPQGGYDLVATLPAGVGSRTNGRRRVIVQVKQDHTLPVQQSIIDALRGTCLRVGASEAVLITRKLLPLLDPVLDGSPH